MAHIPVNFVCILLEVIVLQSKIKSCGAQDIKMV